MNPQNPKKISRREFLKVTAVSGVALGTGMLLSSCAPSSMPAIVTNKPTGTLRLSLGEPINSVQWDPDVPFGFFDDMWKSLVHEPLWKFDDQGNIVPGLANKWELSPDFLKLRVYLQKGIKFHDGTVVKAEDIKANIDRLGDPKAGLNHSLYLMFGITSQIVDDYTIDIIPPAPFSTMVENLAAIHMIPASDISNPAKLKQRPIGAGPFRWVKFENDGCYFEANEDYWMGKPKVANIVLQYIEDLQARASSLQTGEYHATLRPSLEIYPTFQNNSNYQLVGLRAYPNSSIYLFQHKNPALANQDIRKAMVMCWDRPTVIPKIVGSLQPLMDSILPPTARYYTPQTQYPFDLSQAQSLVAGSGITNVSLKMATSSLAPFQSDLDQVFAEGLTKLGFNVDLVPLDVGTYRSTYVNYDINMNGLPSPDPDPDIMLSLETGVLGSMLFNIKDPKGAQMFADTRTATGTARAQKLDALSKYLWDMQNLQPEYDWSTADLIGPKVKNYKKAHAYGNYLIWQVEVTD
jgi:ABC-type transport system substrate-binding protein